WHEGEQSVIVTFGGGTATVVDKLFLPRTRWGQAWHDSWRWLEKGWDYFTAVPEAKGFAQCFDHLSPPPQAVVHSRCRQLSSSATATSSCGPRPAASAPAT